LGYATWGYALILRPGDVASGNILVFTEKEPLSYKIASYIKTNAKASTKVMAVDFTPDSSLAGLIQDPFWEGTQPTRILFSFLICQEINEQCYGTVPLCIIVQKYILQRLFLVIPQFSLPKALSFIFAGISFDAKKILCTLQHPTRLFPRIRYPCNSVR
jgi:hypothetical protein